MSDLTALLIGAAIIVFFSYERFNRITYEGGRRLERLVDLLSPDKLRARRVVLQAWFFYTLALLLIYVVLCAYANVLPLIGGPNLGSDEAGASLLPETATESAARATTGFTPGDGSGVDWSQPLSAAAEPEADSGGGANLGIPPSVSLTMALIIVGLAPSFPVLRRFEDWMRVTAHRLAGIPTRVLADSDELRRGAIQLLSADGKRTDSLLIPRGDWDRREHYRKAAEGQLTAPEDFGNDLDLIFATSAWILDRKLKLDNVEERQRFERLEEELRERKNLLVLELDEKTGFVPGRTRSGGAAPSPEPDDDAAVSELKRGSWERLALDADNLADDLCILLAVYVQHEIVVGDDAVMPEPADAAEEQGEGRRDSVRQQDVARKRLKAFLAGILGEGTAPERVPSFTTMAWFWTLGVVLLVTLLWSVWLGRYEFELRWLGFPPSGYERAIRMVLVAFNGFGVPMIVALAIRDAGRQSHRWQNIWRVHWTVGVPQVALVLLSSWVFAMVFVVGVTFWQVAFQQGWPENESWEAVRGAFEYSAPTMLRGSVLAIVVIYLLDAHEARVRSLRQPATWRCSLIWAAWAAAIMAFVGGMARYAVSWVVLMNSSRAGIDDIDRGLIFYSLIYSALVGFCVVFCIAEVLLNHWPIDGRRRRHHAPKRVPAE